MKENMLVIVGLGNVGKEYENTYHNAGFLAVDEFATKFGFSFSKTKYNSFFAEGVLHGQKVVLLKPKTYMNNSGVAVSEVLRKLKIDAKNLIVVYDDIDLPVGQVRVKASGGAGTHNGMRSIISHIGTQNFYRTRLGIGDKYYDLADYVLSKISKDNAPKIESAINEVVDVLEEFVKADGNLFE